MTIDMMNETLMVEVANMTSGLSSEDHGALSLDVVNPSAVFCVFVVVIAIFTIIWTPVWVFCKCDEGEKEGQGFQEGEPCNGAYQAYALDDIDSGGNFVDVDLSIEIESKSDYIDEDMAGSSSGEAKYSTDSSNYHSGSSLILDAAELMKSSPLETTDFAFKLLPRSSAASESTGKATFLRSLKKFIKSVVCRSQSATFVDRYTSEEDRSGIFHDFSATCESVTGGSDGFCSFSSHRGEPAAYLKRSLSLPTRLKKTTRINTFRDGNEMVPLWIEISTTEEIVKNEASALCSAVILKSLEMQGYFSQLGALDFPSIKITEFNVTERSRSSEEEETIREYLFRVQVPRKISQMLTREREFTRRKHGGSDSGMSAEDHLPEISYKSRVHYKKYLSGEEVVGLEQGPTTPLSSTDALPRTRSFPQNLEENFMKAIMVIYNPPACYGTYSGDNGHLDSGVGTTAEEAFSRRGSTISSP